MKRSRTTLLLAAALALGAILSFDASIAPGAPTGLTQTGYSQEVLADLPAAYWRLEETSGTQATDSSGNAKHGTYQGGPSLGQAGVITSGLAPNFDGTNDGAHVPPAVTISGANPITIEAWVQTTDADGPVLAHRNVAADRGILSLHVGYDGCNAPSNGGTGKPSLFIRNLGDFTDCRHIMISSVAVNDGQPHHIVAARNSSRQWTMYVDGVQRGSMTDTVSDAGLLDLSAIGMERKWVELGYGPPHVRFLAGKVDEVAVYNSALSLARVQAHYQAGTGSPPPAGPPAGQTNGTDEDGDGVHGHSGTRPFADPVNSRTGAFTTTVDDVATPGTGVAFAWSRSYTSADPTVGRLGPGWTDSYSASLIVQGNGDVLLHGEDGQQLYYTKQQDGSFVGAPGSLSTLSLTGGLYKLVRQDQVTYTFTSPGVLTSMKDRNDQGVTLAYDGQNRLSTITDSAGKQVTVSYNASNLVSQVQTQDGRSVGYGYTSGRLTSVTDVRGKTWTHTYDGSGRLATMVDPLNHTQVTNLYDGNGRVQSQTDAVGKTTTFAWDETTGIATATDANNKLWKHDYDGNILAKEIDPLENFTELGHDSDLNTDSVESPTNETTTMSYDGAGNLLTATAPASLGSAQKSFVYNAKNDPTQITDARNKVTSYTYTPAGNTQTVTQDGTQVGSYTYDAAGRVLTFTDGNQKTTTYTYFPATGYLESVTDPLGNKTTYTYDGAGRMLTRVDPKGNVVGCGCAAQFTWTYTYNPAGQVLTETNPLGKVTTHTYDDAGNELTVTDANGKTTSYAYDNANRLLSVTAPDTGVTSYTYDNVGNRLTETDPLNHTTTFTHDSANRLASSTTASGAKTTYFYDPNGNLIKQVEPRGNVGGGVNPDDFATTFTYNAAGRLLTETDPLGNVTTHTYDAVGNELTLKDPNNKTTTNTYDGLNRLSTVTAPDGGVTTYTYDNAGNKLTEKDPRDNVTNYTYDDANRLQSVTKAAGGKTTYAYDANGNQTSMVEPRGNVMGCGCAAQYTWTYAHDRVNRKLSETSPLGHTTAFAYDDVGNQLSMTDANTRVTAFTYDPVNRLKTVTAPDLGVTTHTYDLAGNLTERKDARNNVTTYGYDVDNRRTSVTNPLSKVWTTSYDPAGNVLQTVDANGNATPAPGDGQTTFTYNRAGRLTGIDYSDTTPDVTFTYDNAGNRLTMVDGSGTETRTYDPVNRLASVTRGTDAFSYAYDLAGNLTQRTYPGNVSTSYTYDADNRLATAVEGTLTTTYTYDPAGNLTLATLPSANGHSDTRIYDNAGRLIEVKNVRAPSTIRSRFVITLDPVGNPTRIDRTGALTQTQTYTYDANDRILTVCFLASCAPTSPERIAWTYDLVGNRLTETRSTGATPYTYNAGDQMLSAGATNYTYDSNGNQVSAGGQPFTYDLANRLKTMTQGATTTAYIYDGDGKRLQSSTGSAASAKTNFLWDVNHALQQVALERNGNNVLQRQYIYGSKRIRQTQGAGASYYLYDGLGSIVNTTAPAGALQKTYSYEPFGAIRTETGSSPTNFFHFTGEYRDPTGLYHLRARQYDPTTGRFVQPDPVEPALMSRSTSSYLYADDRPTVFIDPTGERPEFAVEGQTMARFVSSSVAGNDGNNCTVVPDSVGVWVVTLIDFSPSCEFHDRCYGDWKTFRKPCDDEFHVRMQDQCVDKYRHTILFPWDRYGRSACGKVAGVYYWGVQQLGNVAWPDKAHRHDPAARTGCPWTRNGPGGARIDVPRCLAYVMARSYPPYNPNVVSITAALSRKILVALLPLPSLPIA